MLGKEKTPRWRLPLSVLLAATAGRDVQSGRKITGHFEAGVNRRHDGLGPGLHIAFLLPVETRFDVGTLVCGVKSPLNRT
jgi:hypothetical protein